MPGSEIRDKDVFSQVQLWLIEEDPTARSSAPASKGWPQFLTQDGRGVRVRASGSWEEMELASQHLSDLVRRCREDILVRRLLGCGRDHRSSLTAPGSPRHAQSN